MSDVINIVDPHIHLFNLAQGQYHWLAKNNPPCWPDKQHIYRDFFQGDMLLDKPLSLSGFVHIEAGFDNMQPWREIQWLEQHCTLPFRSIAAIDLTLPTLLFQQQLQQLMTFPSVIGIRHLLGNLNEQLCSDRQVITNLNYVNQWSLNVELQMQLAELSEIDSLVALITANTDTHFIVEHAGFPPAKSDLSQWQRWQNHLNTIAKYRNVLIKCSGWEMVSRDYQNHWIQQVIDHCLQQFCSTRVMLASNFPVVLLAKPYQDYWQHLIGQVDTHYRQALLRDNAIYYYKIPVSPPPKN